MCGSHLPRVAQFSAALLACVVLQACSPTTDATRGEATFGLEVPQDRYADANGIRLHYLDWGGEGTLLLLVPGLSHTAHTYDAIAPSLADRFHVVSVTRREHGASEKPGGPIDLETLVDDLDAFLGLFSEDDVILAGQSYAGLELPRLAKRHPDRVTAVIFLDAVYDWPGWLEPGPPFPGYFNPPASFESYSELESWFSDLYPEIWSEAARAHLISQTYMAEDGSIRWHFPVEGPHWARFLEVDREWTPAEFEGLDLSVLSIQAEQGGFMTNNLLRAGAPSEVADTAQTWADDLDNVLKRLGREALAEAVPRAVMVEYSDTHHWLHLQSPDRVILTILEFLETQGGAGP